MGFHASPRTFIRTSVHLSSAVFHYPSAEVQKVFEDQRKYTDISVKF